MSSIGQRGSLSQIRNLINRRDVSDADDVTTRYRLLPDCEKKTSHMNQ